MNTKSERRLIDGRTFRKILLAAGVAFGLAVCPAVSAGATSLSAVEGEGVGGGEACWFEAEGRSACASTQEELAQLVHDEFGVMFVAPASGRALPESLQLPSLAADAQLLDATYVMGILHADGGMSGDSFTHTTSLKSEPCDSYGDYVYGGVENLNVIDGYFGTSWNDRISSFEGYGMCGYEMWSDGGWAGSSFGPSGSAGVLGAFNDQASSLKVRKVG